MNGATGAIAYTGSSSRPSIFNGSFSSIARIVGRPAASRVTAGAACPAATAGMSDAMASAHDNKHPGTQVVRDMSKNPRSVVKKETKKDP